MQQLEEENTPSYSALTLDETRTVPESEPEIATYINLQMEHRKQNQDKLGIHRSHKKLRKEKSSHTQNRQSLNLLSPVFRSLSLPPNLYKDPPSYEQIIEKSKVDINKFPSEAFTIHKNNKSINNDIKIDMESSQPYGVVMVNTQVWQNENNVGNHEKLYKEVQETKKSLLPNYNSLIHYILNDSPPDYETVTGVHVNVEEVVATETPKPTTLGSRNTQNNNTLTCDDLHIPKTIRITIVVVIFICLIGVAGFFVGRVMTETTKN